MFSILVCVLFSWPTSAFIEVTVLRGLDTIYMSYMEAQVFMSCNTFVIYASYSSGLTLNASGR